MEKFENMDDAVREAHLRHHQQMDAQRHDVRRLLTELDKEHLVTLHDLFGLIAASDEAAALNAAGIHGQAKAYLESRFNICSACSIDHEAAQPTREQIPDHGVILDPAYQGIVDRVAEAAGPANENECSMPLPELYRQFLVDNRLDGLEGPDLKVGETGPLSLRQVHAMKHWKLDDIRDEGTGVFLGFICLGCMAMTHPTIEDRALKAPDDCSGCHQQAAHG